MRTRSKAVFDNTICSTCPLAHRCSTFKKKHGRHGDQGRVFYFTHATYLAQQRHSNLGRLPPERQMLRANIEATVCEFTRKIPGGKLKVRGAFKTVLFAYAMGISINFGRIVRYVGQNLASTATLLVRLSPLSQHSLLPKPLLPTIVAVCPDLFLSSPTPFIKFAENSPYFQPKSLSMPAKAGMLTVPLSPE
jgi:hypothetical protein